MTRIFLRLGENCLSQRSATISRFLLDLLLGFLCLVLATQHAAAQEISNSPRYLPLYQFVVEMDRVAHQLPDEGRLRKIEFNEQGFKYQGSLSPTDVSAIAIKLSLGIDSQWRDPYEVSALHFNDGMDGFEMHAKFRQGLFLPTSSQKNQPKLDRTYQFRVLQYSVENGIHLDGFKWTPIGLDSGGLSRFEFKVTTTYKSLISWLLNAPVLSESLIDHVSIVKQNSMLVTMQGAVYAGDLVLTQMQDVSIREQLQLTRETPLVARNPFADAGVTQRNREPLELVRLTDLSVVAVIRKMGQDIALVKSNLPPAQLFQVRVGNYLGTQQGRIVAIDDKNIEIAEVVMADNGKEFERRSFLPVERFPAKQRTEQPVR